MKTLGALSKVLAIAFVIWALGFMWINSQVGYTNHWKHEFTLGSIDPNTGILDVSRRIYLKVDRCYDCYPLQELLEHPIQPHMTLGEPVFGEEYREDGTLRNNYEITGAPQGEVFEDGTYFTYEVGDLKVKDGWVLVGGKIFQLDSDLRSRHINEMLAKTKMQYAYFLVNRDQNNVPISISFPQLHNGIFTVAWEGDRTLLISYLLDYKD